MNPLEHLLKRLSWLVTAVGSILVALMALHVSLDIVSRVLLNMPLAGTVEIVSRYYMVAVIFLPLAAAQTAREHFQADLFKPLLPDRFWRVTDAFNDLVLCLLAGLFTWRSTIAALEATAIGEQVQSAYFTIPVWPSRWFVSIGMGLLCLAAFVQLLTHVRSRTAASPDPLQATI